MQFELDWTNIVLGITGAIGGLGLWARRERGAWAKSNEDVAKSKANTSVHESKSEEMEFLRKELNDLRTVSVNQTARLSILEAAQLGISAHLDNLVLCDNCKLNNKIFLNAMEKALAKSLHSEEEHAKPHDH